MASVRDAYTVFLRTSAGVHAYSAFKKLLYSASDSLPDELISQMELFLPHFTHEPIYVCDIGTGDCRRILRILAFMRQRLAGELAADLVEQSEVLLSSCDLEALANLCEYRIYPQMIADVSFDRRYDVIFFIHSIFSLSGDEDIERIVKLLRMNGVIVVVSNASDSFLGRLKVLLDDDYTDARFEIDDFLASASGRQLGITKRSFVTRWHVKEGDLDNCIATITEWLSLGKIRDYSVAKKIRIYNFFREHSKALDGKLFFEEEEVVITLSYL